MTIKILNEAMQFALKAHGSQYYGRMPYEVHLLDCINVLRRFHDSNELTQDTINAMWLHDVVEDTRNTTKITVDDIRLHFGPTTAGLVWAVTDEPGETREERKKNTYPKIRATPGAIVLKLADRIANLEQGVSFQRVGRKPGKYFTQYLKEWPSFQEELRNLCAGEGYSARAMWSHLDNLIAHGKGEE